MPPKLLFDVDGLDLERVEYSLEEIRAVNPQRFEFEQLTAVLAYRPEDGCIAGLRDVRSDEFWVRGHVPERPLLPGVLMLEAAAQLCSFYTLKTLPPKDGDGFYGFGGVDRARFRGVVVPGEKLFLLARVQTLTPSRSLFATQGVVSGKIVFEANILGIRIR